MTTEPRQSLYRQRPWRIAAAVLAFDALFILVFIVAVLLTRSEGPDDEFMSTPFFALCAVGIGAAALLFDAQVIAILVWALRGRGRQRRADGPGAGPAGTTSDAGPGRGGTIDARRPALRHPAWLALLAPLALDGLYVLLIVTIARRVERPPYTDGELFGLGLLFLLWAVGGVILLATQVGALLTWGLVWFVRDRRERATG